MSNICCLFVLPDAAGSTSSTSKTTTTIISSFTTTEPTELYIGQDTRSQSFIAPSSQNGIVNASVSALFTPIPQNGRSWGCLEFCLCYLDGSNTCSNIKDPNAVFCVLVFGCGAVSTETYSASENWAMLSGRTYAFVIECNPQAGTASDFSFIANFDVIFSFLNSTGSKNISTHTSKLTESFSLKRCLYLIVIERNITLDTGPTACLLCSAGTYSVPGQILSAHREADA